MLGWQARGLGAIPVAVNVSAVQFRQEGFRDLVKRVLQETGLPPQYLELELTVRSRHRLKLVFVTGKARILQQRFMETFPTRSQLRVTRLVL